MDKLIVGFSKPKKWKPFAWLIMKAYNIPYDHVYLKWHSDYYNRDIIYQASKTIINFMGTAVFEAENEIYKEFEIDISTENKKALMQFAIDNAGKPYSIKEIIGLSIVWFVGLFGKKISNPFKAGTDEYVCSILAEYILENYTNQNTPGDFQDITPKDIFTYLNSK